MKRQHRQHDGGCQQRPIACQRFRRQRLAHTKAAAIDAHAFAERLAGNIKAHAFYAVRADNTVAPPRPDDPDVIPAWFDADPEPLRKALKPGGVLNISAEGVSLRFPLPRLAAVIAAAIDGKRTLQAIFETVAAKAGPLERPAFMTQFAALYATLHGAGKLFLRLPA